MTQLMTAVHNFVDDEEGITAIEYGLIAAVMAALIGSVFLLLNTSMTALFNKISTKLTT